MFMERLHELRKGPVPSAKMCDLLHTDRKLELGTLLAHVDASYGSKKIGPEV